MYKSYPRRPHQIFSTNRHSMTKPPKMISVMDLPNEILFKIVDCLDPADIDVLFLVPELRFRLKQAVCLFTDHSKSHRHHKNIRTVHHIGGDEVLVNIGDIRKSVHCCVIEVHHWKTDLNGTLKTICDTIPHHLVYYADRLPYNVRPPQIRPSTFPVTPNTRSITCNLESIDDDMATLSPELFRFPIATTLTLTHCSFPPDTQQKFHLPLLETAGILGTPPEDFFRSVYWPSLTSLKTLDAASKQKSIDWRGIPIASLSKIKLRMDNLISLGDCIFPSLVVLEVSTTNLATVSNLRLPKAKILRLSTSTRMDIHDVDAPSLEQFHISVESLARCERIKAPNISRVHILINGATVDPDPRNIMTGMVGTITGETTSSSKSPIDFNFIRNVQDLNFFDNCNSLMTRNEVSIPPLNNMTDLKVHYPLELRNWPYRNAKELKKLTMQFIVLSREDLTLSDIVKWHPKLCKLQIGNIVSIGDGTIFFHVLKGDSFGDLKSLKIPRTGPNIAINIDNAHFENLQVLEVWQPISYAESTPVRSVFNFTAPKIRSISIRGFKDVHLDVSKYPLLKNLTLIGCLRYVNFGESHEGLQYVSLSQNKNLLPVEPTVLPNVTEFQAYDTPFAVLQNIKLPK